MYALEYKQLHIVKEPMLKNSTTQTFRWRKLERKRKNRTNGE